MYSYLMEDIPFLSFSFAFSGKMVGAKTEARADVIKLIPEISSLLMLQITPRLARTTMLMTRPLHI